MVVLAACRNDEEEVQPLPTAMPTAAMPDTGSSESEATATPADVAEAATATPRPTPTMEPVPTVDVADIDWPPQPVYKQPCPGEEVMLDGERTLRFDQPMTSIRGISLLLLRQMAALCKVNSPGRATTR
ncbi:MAG: hypothetical protein R3E31_11450 [Chloroflexota bacterium]